MTKPIPLQIPQLAVALLSGLIFGFGLSLSGMLDPARVRGFLDLFGHFDPSLAFVLAGAVAVSGAGYALSRRLKAPVFDDIFHIPERTTIDRPLVFGAAVFGTGWGVGGFAPGPASRRWRLASPPPSSSRRPWPWACWRMITGGARTDRPPSGRRSRSSRPTHRRPLHFLKKAHC